VETGFTIVLLVLVFLFYLSNPNNKVNKWCAMSGFLFWLGIAKEAVLYNILPKLGSAGLYEHFMPVNSVCTWALYSLAMPTTVIFSLYFCDMDQSRPERMRFLKMAMYVPALILLFFFSPMKFHFYQLNSLPFWITYAVYNFSFGIAFTCLMIKGVRIEKPGKAKTQKKRVAMMILPPVLFWMTSVFITHPFQMNGLLKLWRYNTYILIGCVAFFIIMAFHDGFMGLRLSRETYSWNSDMSLINTSAEYWSHMLKSQTSKMELCIEQLKTQFEQPPEELAILSRSIATLKSYMDKIKRQSQEIHLLEEPCRITEMLADAMSGILPQSSGITVNIGIADNVFCLCDKSHMTELFSNIITNAAEAIQGSGTIEITGAYDKSSYLLRIKDSGIGMDDDMVNSIFTPYFTTKNTEKNFGLGLAYCKNVITKHGGDISAKSKRGKGTTITVAIPARRIASGTEGRDE